MLKTLSRISHMIEQLPAENSAPATNVPWFLQQVPKPCSSCGLHTYSKSMCIINNQ